MIPIRILIIDDEEHVLEDHGQISKRFHNIEIDRVNQALQAIELLSGEPYDLVLTDVQVIETNADDLLKVAHEHNPELPFIVATDTDGREAFLRNHDCTSIGFIAKPLCADELLAAVSGLLKEEVHAKKHRP